MYSFNIETTYVCIDEVYSDDHHPIIFTFVYLCMSCHSLHGDRSWNFPEGDQDICLKHVYDISIIKIKAFCN